MKVYILINKYDSQKIEGVFKNEEDADQMWDSFDPPYQDEYTIEEHDVIK
jgi:hypothetical protein